MGSFKGPTETFPETRGVTTSLLGNTSDVFLSPATIYVGCSFPKLRVCLILLTMFTTYCARYLFVLFVKFSVVLIMKFDK